MHDNLGLVSARSICCFSGREESLCACPACGRSPVRVGSRAACCRAERMCNEETQQGRHSLFCSAAQTDMRTETFHHVRHAHERALQAHHLCSASMLCQPTGGLQCGEAAEQTCLRNSSSCVLPPILQQLWQCCSGRLRGAPCTCARTKPVQGDRGSFGRCFAEDRDVQAHAKRHCCCSYTLH